MEVRELPFTPLSREQQDGLLSLLWQNDQFRNYIIKRETELVVEMAGKLGRKPSDEEYSILFGRRLEVMHLMAITKAAYERNERKKEDSRLAKVAAESPRVLNSKAGARPVNVIKS